VAKGVAGKSTSSDRGLAVSRHTGPGSCICAVSVLARGGRVRHPWGMSNSASGQATNSAPAITRKQLAIKIVGLVLLMVVLGMGQDWMASGYDGIGRRAGFHTGVIQGALMPAALPALLMGKDVPIYAQANEGRFYKIGYIVGINACGVLFFGFAFWRPRPKVEMVPTVKGAS
jgi:hypothetical protein